MSASTLTDLAATLLVLKKTGVLSLGVKILGLGGGAAGAAEAGGAVGLWARILPGVRLAGGALAATLIVTSILKNTQGPGDKPGQNIYDNPFGADPKAKDPAKQGISTWVGLGHQIERIADDIRIFIVGSWSKTWAQVTGIMGKLAGFITGSWNTTSAQVSGAVSRLGSFITGSWNRTYAQVSGIIGQLVSFITGSWDRTYSAVSGTIGRLVSFLAASWNRATANARSAWNAVASFFTQIWNQVYGTFSSAISRLTSFLSGSWNQMATTARNVWNSVVTWVTGPLSNAFRTAFQGVVNGVSAVWSTLRTVALEPVKYIIDVIYDQGIVGVVNRVGSLIGLQPAHDPPRRSRGGREDHHGHDGHR